MARRPYSLTLFYAPSLYMQDYALVTPSVCSYSSPRWCCHLDIQGVYQLVLNKHHLEAWTKSNDDQG